MPVLFFFFQITIHCQRKKTPFNQQNSCQSLASKGVYPHKAPACVEVRGNPPTHVRHTSDYHWLYLITFLSMISQESSREPIKILFCVLVLIFYCLKVDGFDTPLPDQKAPQTLGTTADVVPPLPFRCITLSGRSSSSTPPSITSRFSSSFPFLPGV